MDRAFFEVVRELERLKNENEELKKKLESEPVVKKKSKALTLQEEQDERSRRWAARYYQNDFDKIMKAQAKKVDELRARGAKVGRPFLVIENDCMDFYGKK